jgi:hypothetical protein
MCGWSDDGSGLSRFKVDVFYLNLDQNNRLAELGERLSISDDNVSPLNSGYYFTLPTSGVYSIQLTVFDRANNTARARKILNYDGDSKWTGRLFDWLSACSVIGQRRFGCRCRLVRLPFPLARTGIVSIAYINV